MTRAPILEGTRANAPILSPRFSLKSIFRGFSVTCALAAILITSGCVGVTGKGAGNAGSTAITLGLSPSSISFGTLTVGQSSTKTVTLTNTGTGILTISGISVTGPGFTASGPHLPIALSADQNTTISVLFKPTSSAADTGTITITSNASEPSMAVALSGTGTAAATSILSVSPSSIAFGSVAVGSEVTKTVQLASTGTGSVTISGMTFSGAGVSVTGLALPATLAAGKDANLTVIYKPTSAGTLAGSVSIASNASDPSAAVGLSGTATTSPTSALTATPSSITFGNVVVGTESSQTIRLANSGTASVTVSGLAPSVATVSVSGLTIPMTLAPGASANFTAAFKPTAASSVSGKITVTSNASDASMPINLTGTGQTAVIQLTASPTSVSFGSATTGSTNAKQVTVTNTGNENAIISSVTVAGTGFSLGSAGTGVTLNPGQSQTYTIDFDPKTAASATGTLSIASNAPSSPMKLALAGTAVAPSTSHSVALSWDRSTSTVLGYFVYRSSKPSGPYAKMNSSADSSTSYSDSTVASGQVYYYVVTAVDSTNIESSYSNQVSVTIPTN
ncbi:MAG: choice-of-anchor D domain-containing protein [Candidatus Acidiferrales bacterium]